jgi:hypothetical protein
VFLGVTAGRAAGYCANCGFRDVSNGGYLFSVFHHSPSFDGMLGIAYRISASVADLQNVDIQGRPTITYTDIKLNQWLRIDGGYMLTDFNRARLLTWDRKLNLARSFR